MTNVGLLRFPFHHTSYLPSARNPQHRILCPILFISRFSITFFFGTTTLAALKAWSENDNFHRNVLSLFLSCICPSRVSLRVYPMHMIADHHETSSESRVMGGLSFFLLPKHCPWTRLSAFPHPGGHHLPFSSLRLHTRYLSCVYGDLNLLPLWIAISAMDHCIEFSRFGNPEKRCILSSCLLFLNEDVVRPPEFATTTSQNREN